MWPLRHGHRDELSSRRQPKILGHFSTGVTPERQRGRAALVRIVAEECGNPIARAASAPEGVAHAYGFGQCKHHGQASRPISTRQLRALLLLHTGPINLVVFKGSLGRLPCGRHHLEAGFTLRCFQRLSQPNVATQLCLRRDNWCTRGSSIPVLSY